MIHLGKALTKLKKIIIGFILFELAYLFNSALSGIIGNRSDVYFVEKWKSINSAIFPHFIYISIIIFISLISISIIYLYKEITDISSKHSAHVIQMDKELFNLLPALIDHPNRDELKRLLAVILSKNSKIFDGISRSSVLIPNEDKTSLNTLASYQMPLESINREFYIGPNLDPSQTRGVAGQCFLDKKIRTPVMDKNSNWKSSDDQYIIFDKNRHRPPYESFITAPILTSNGDCIGVLCLDSDSPNTFDDDEIKSLVLSIAGRIGSILLLFNSMEQLINTRSHHEHDS